MARAKHTIMNLWFALDLTFHDIVHGQRKLLGGNKVRPRSLHNEQRQKGSM